MFMGKSGTKAVRHHAHGKNLVHKSQLLGIGYFCEVDLINYVFPVVTQCSRNDS